METYKFEFPLPNVWVFLSFIDVKLMYIQCFKFPYLTTNSFSFVFCFSYTPIKIYYYYLEHSMLKCYFNTQNTTPLVGHLKHIFSVFKQHYTYFHTLFHPHVFQKIQTTLLKFLYQTGHKTHSTSNMVYLKVFNS